MTSRKPLIRNGYCLQYYMYIYVHKNVYRARIEMYKDKEYLMYLTYICISFA